MAVRGRVSGVVLLGALALAVAVALYLVSMHVQYAVEGATGGLCNLSENLNCNGVIQSRWSTLFDFPMALYALGFYGALFALTAFRAGIGGARNPVALDITVLALIPAVIWSLVLLAIMIVEVGVLCPMCLLLDVSALTALIAGSLAADGGIKGVFGRLGGAVRGVMGADGAIAAAAGASLFLVGAWATQGILDQATGEDVVVTVDEAYERVVGYPTRHALPGSDEAPIKGDPAAPVVIVEFSDFQCPHCGRFRRTLEGISEQFGDDVAVRFMHYPMSNLCNENIDSEFHEHACRAAAAANCAGEEGQFWPMHDLLFDNQRQLSAAHLREYAGSLGIDRGAFDACLADAGTLARVRADIATGHAAATATEDSGVGTPFFFVNGLHVRGAQPAPVIEALVRAELAAGEEATPQ